MEHDKMTANLKREISDELRREMSASQTTQQATTFVVNTGAAPAPASVPKVNEEQEEPKPERHWSIQLIMVIGAIIAGIIFVVLTVAAFLCQCLCEMISPRDEVVRRGCW
jgi:predicted cobalt transporter CbtA